MAYHSCFRSLTSRCVYSLGLTLLAFIQGIVPGLVLGRASAESLEEKVRAIRLPPGFSISVFAKDIPNARAMTRGDRGTIFVGSRRAGKVYAVRDENSDGVADRVHTIASGLDLPVGVTMRGTDLYVGEVTRIVKFSGIEERLENPPEPVVVTNDLPNERLHGWKFIDFGPDGQLYVQVGAPCNTCLRRTERRFGTILRMDADGKNQEIVAEGIRNTVGFTWHPVSKVMWFTDNGADMMGDDRPPDELNSMPESGLHFGFPYCHGKSIPDLNFHAPKPCTEYQAPEQELGAHVAALGPTFYTGEMFPEDYRNQLFIAEHGSWNRSKKSGYRVTLVRLKEGRAVSYETFAEGWLVGEDVWGRPVDTMVLPDGSLLVSDDQAGALYRIAYQKK
ncbi:MAG: sorbosone dehydrogenase family protein [Deltaproteobacteria bacterium]|nr:sorbosone dehydrogenase family protein [Deltaproteobacteria bacterium]